MPSHLHLICSTHGDPLSGIVRDFKTHTAKEIIKGIDTVFESRRLWMLGLFEEVGRGLNRITNYKVWQDGNHPILLDTPKLTWEKMEYVHNNPVAEEIVSEPEHYLYSSARDYCTNRKGYLQIEFAE